MSMKNGSTDRKVEATQSKASNMSNKQSLPNLLKSGSK